MGQITQEKNTPSQLSFGLGFPARCCTEDVEDWRKDHWSEGSEGGPPGTEGDFSKLGEY